MPTYVSGTPEAMETLMSVIDDFHPGLRDAAFRLLQASTLKAGKPVKITKAGPSELADGHDLVVVYDSEAFLAMNDETRRAFFDHALSGWVGEQKKGRNGQLRWIYKSRPPLEIHPDVVERHQGAVPQWRNVAEIFKQMTLDLNFGSKGENVDLR